MSFAEFDPLVVAIDHSDRLGLKDTLGRFYECTSSAVCGM